MSLSVLDSDGQVQIPSEIQKLMSLKPGDPVNFVVDQGRVYLQPIKKPAMRLAGILRRPNQPVLTLEDMDQAIADAVAESIQ